MRLDHAMATIKSIIGEYSIGDGHFLNFLASNILCHIQLRRQLATESSIYNAEYNIQQTIYIR